MRINPLDAVFWSLDKDQQNTRAPQYICTQKNMRYEYQGIFRSLFVDDYYCIIDEPCPMDEESFLFTVTAESPEL
jgi:hypothetical protein